ncbi:hypothetical protein GCM10009016_18100 [Halomonas beimenensis]
MPIGVGLPAPQPGGVVPLHLIAVADAQPHVVEAVVGRRQLAVRVLGPAAAHLPAVGLAVSLAAQAMTQVLRWHLAPTAARAPLGRRDVGHVLEVGLADVAGALARTAQYVGEGDAVQVGGCHSGARR